MTTAAGVLLIVAAMAVLTGAVLQIVQFRHGRQIISRSQLVRRLVMALVLLTIIAMIFFGAVYAWPDPLSALIFWTASLVLAVFVIALAMADLRAVERERHIKQAELYRAIQQIQDAHKKPPGGTD